MERDRKIATGLVFGLIAAAGVAWAASGRERSLAIYPPQRIPLIFDHALHMEEGADCVSCHDPARKSVKVADVSLPKHPECEGCHDIEAAARGKRVDPKSACKDCHPGFDHTVQKNPARVDFPAPNIIFNHKVHVDKKVDCTVCHTDMTDVALATRMQLPKMETCLHCHDGVRADAACKECHPTAQNGKLQLTFASGVLRPTQGNPFGMDHGPRFEFTHGTRASIDRPMCMECHTDAECQTCHDGLQKPLAVHPNDFITLHPVQARMEMSRCESCHRHQSFCVSCHERSGVGMDSDPSLRPLNVRVHPDYNVWVETPVGPQHHGVQASRDIKQCIACHREESCMACHASLPGSRSINPHPEFGRSCKAFLEKNDRPCIKCHTDTIRTDPRCL